jgi:hypothetical protein
MKHRGFIAVIFLIGCATGGVASQLVVPPARAGTASTHWEYVCGRVASGSLSANLNKAGADGWELVSVVPASQDTQFGSTSIDDYTFCAKRGLP